MKNNPFTRFLSVALTAVMLVGVMPGAVLADAGEAIVGASSAVVESIPESTTPADAAPVATEVPPVTEPEATPEAAQPEASPEVEATPEATEQPETTPEATQEPEATPEATEQPETTPEATQEPEATPEAAEEPEATPEATEEPETSPEPTEEPVELNKKAYIETAEVAEGVTVTVKVPANTLPEDVDLVAEMLAEDTQAHADAEAALAEAEVQYDGMIAMDIRFEDAEGNEVEPANEVEVSIDAQALLPEDADPETVAVQHLKEDATGAVSVETVADAAPATGDITVAENAEQPALNMASTFAVDGFSTFTITWGRSYTLNVTCYNFETGAVLPETEKPANISLYSGETIYLNADNTKLQIPGYTLVRAEGYYSGYYTWQEITSVQADYDRYYGWSLTADNRYTLNKNQGIKLYYEKSTQTNPETIQGVQPDGVTVNLFNYDTGFYLKKESSTGYVDSEWRRAGLLFSGGAKESAENHWTGSEDVYPGIVAGQLGLDGFPMRRVTAASLSALFTAGEGVTAYSNVKNLFLQKGSEYYYNSDENFAELTGNPTDGYEFTLYRDTNENAFTAAEAPKFLPFNSFKTGQVKDNSFTRVDYNATYPVDYHFGMTIDFDFAQPAEGKVSGQNMVFSFTGDDDVWLFVDGVLVLDMGGIHDKATGKVDFATGKIIINEGETTKRSTTLYNCFTEAGYTTEQLNDLFVQDSNGNYRFRDYTTHSFDYFYLERGAGGSNCQISFNLPTIPSSDLAVAKKITKTGTNEEIDEQTDFTFELKNDETPVSSRPYVVYDLNAYTQDPSNPGDPEGNGITEFNGTFTLKADQVAVFEDIIEVNSQDVYTVTEQLIGKVVENVSTVYVDGVASQDYSTTLTANDRYALFDNWIKDQGEYQLSLTKQWKGSNSDLDASAIPFTEVRVTVEQYYKTGDGTTTTVANSDELILNSENGWTDGYSEEVFNYTAFRVSEEKVYIGRQLIVTYTYRDDGTVVESWENEEYATEYSDWTIGEFEFDRKYSGIAEGFQVKPSNSSLNITVQTSGAVIVRNKNDAVIWTPYLDVMSDSAKEALLNSIQMANMPSGWGNVSKYYLMDETLPASLSGARETLQNLQYNGETVSLQFKGSNEWNKVAWGGLALSSTEISASLTNTLDTENATTEVKVTKRWNDSGNPNRPEQITVNLLKVEDNQKVGSETLNESNEWTHTFTNLPKYNADGTLVEYTVEEVAVPGYTTKITGDMETGFTITNTLANVDLTIVKDIDGDPYNDGRDMFNFRVVKYKDNSDDVEKVWYVNIWGEDTATLEDIPAGRYTVTELDNIHYKMTDVDPDPQNIAVGTTRAREIDGYEVNKDTTITFTNEPVPTNIPTDGGGVENQFSMEGNKIKITAKKEYDTVVTPETNIAGE